MPDWLTFWTALLALTTLLVALVAVFQDKIRNWISRPKLEVVLTVSPPDCHKTSLVQIRQHSSYDYPAGSQQKSDCYYFRFRVKNVGNQRAEYVEVFASELLKQKADGTFAPVDSFLSMNLVWSHIREPFTPAISPGMEKLCDLGHVIDPSKRSAFVSEHNPTLNIQDDQTTWTFDVEVASFTMGHVIAPGTYRFKVLIGSANCNPIKKTFEITLTGKWFGEERKMLSEGIGLKVL